MLRLETLQAFGQLYSGFLGLFLVFGLLILFTAPRSKLKYIGALLLCQGVILLGTYSKVSLLAENYSFLFRLAFPFQLAVPPLVYFHLSSTIRNQNYPFRTILPHFLPFALGCIWYLTFFALDRPEYFTLSKEFLFEKYLRRIVGLAVLAPYSITLYRLLQDLRVRASDQLSDLESLHLPWIQFLSYLSIVATTLFLLDILSGPSLPLWIFDPVLGMAGILGLIYFSLKTSRLLEEPALKSEKMAARPNTTSLDSSELTRLTEKLKDHLESKKPYLEPQLRLSELASRLSIKPYLLTEVIRNGMNTQFLDLMNRYRLEHARKMILDPKARHLNLLGIASESGFHSKSTFNDAFKKHFGTTPSEFRRQALGPSPSTPAEL